MESVITQPAKPSATTLERRRVRMQELYDGGAVGAPRFFAMLFFHGIESAVKAQCSSHGPREAYESVKMALRGRTLARGHAFLRFEKAGVPMPAFDEEGWRACGLGVEPAALAGFGRLVEGAAASATETSGVEASGHLVATFRRFVELGASVREPAGAGSSSPWGESLGGEPDSAHFFSFAELALARLEVEPDSAFWLELARASVAAQPRFLALHFVAARRVPRKAVDYGPGDILHDPAEFSRRAAAAPTYRALSRATPGELAGLVGRHARAGLLG